MLKFFNQHYQQRPKCTSCLLGVLVGMGFEPLNFILGPFIGLGLFFYTVFIYQPINPQADYPESVHAQLTHSLPNKTVFMMGWLFGMGYFVTGLYWTACALHVQIDTLWPLIPFAVLGIPAVCSLVPALTAYLTHICRFRRNISKLLFFCIVWITLEWIRGHTIVGGFPWLLLGDIWIHYLPMAQLYAVVGNYGLTLLTLVIILGLTLCHTLKSFSLMMIPLIIAYGWGFNRLQQQPNFNHAFRVVLIQPNIQQINKWQPNLLRHHVDRLTQATRTPNNAQATVPNVFIMPEAAIPYRLNREKYLGRYITQHLNRNDILVTGSTRVVQREDNNLLYNALFVLDHQGNIKSSYDKVHLTPFGEYIPYRNYIPAFVHTLVGHHHDFSFGLSSRVIDSAGIPSFLPLICYEGIFLDEINPDHQFEWIINITNDGWFLNSSGPYQHLAMIRACAIAWGTPVVRVANTGISAIIDGHGRFVSRLDYGHQGNIVGHIPNKLSGGTVFSNYGKRICAILYAILWIAFLGSFLIRQNRQA